MNERLTFPAAETIVRTHLEHIRDSHRTQAHGHRPDDAGEYPHAHRVSREIAELIDTVLSGNTLLSPDVTVEVAEAFEAGDPIAAVNKLLEELAFGPLLCAPTDVIEQLSSLLGSASGTELEAPTLESRTRRKRINYLMQRHHISRAEAQKKLDDIIAQFKSQFSRMPDDADLDELLERA